MTIANADDIKANFDSIKVDLMGGVSVSWVDGANEKNISNGVANVFQKTYYGTYGFTAHDFDSGEDRGNWSWVTSFNKTSDKGINGATPVPHTDYAVLAQEQFQDIAGLAKRIYLPSAAIVHIRVGADVFTPELNQWGVTERLVGYDGKTASHTYLFIDEQKVTHTLGYSFEEHIGLPPTSEVGHGITDSLNFPTVLWTQRYYSTCHSIYMQAGWHTINVRTDCRVERSYAARKSIVIEGWYQ